MTTIGKYVGSIVRQGAVEAQKDGSATIEAHHLLLAIAAVHEPTTRQVLTSVGIDHEMIRNALDREFEQSLSAAGVTLAAARLPKPGGNAERPKRMGASARLALQRGFTSGARRKHLQPAHLLVGILQAQIGTVPRALALARVDQDDLLSRLRQTLEMSR